MEFGIVEELLKPWWKIVVYIVASALAIVSIRLSLTLDLNALLKERRVIRAARETEKRVAECGHVWTLYPNSPYSQCNLCTAFIFTSTLVYAVEHLANKPLIVGVDPGTVIRVGEGSIVATDYIGQRK